MVKYLNSALQKILRKSDSCGKRYNTTVFVDLDGTLVKHRYYHFHKVEILDGVISRLQHMQEMGTYIVLTTGRRKKDCKWVLRAFKSHGVVFDQCIFDLPTCRRILINDDKFPGQVKALAYTYPRNRGISEFSDY